MSIQAGYSTHSDTGAQPISGRDIMTIRFTAALLAASSLALTAPAARQFLRAAVGPDMGVKASGGIRDAATVRAMIDAGATRIGCSASVAIVSEDAGD